MSKVIPLVVGGLGNQLFIYSTARRLALKNNAELVLDDFSGFSRDYVYERQYQLKHFHISFRKATSAERLEPFARVRRYFKRRWSQLSPFEQRSYLVQEGVDYDPRILELKPASTLYMEGYWQSEDYFKDIEAVIRQDLRIKPPVDSTNLQVAKLIQEKTAVAMHVRFFDDPGGECDNNAPEDYYQRAVKMMESLTDDAHYFIFSDKPEKVSTNIPLPKDRFTLVTHNQGDENAYADLWLMTLCQYFIIANSTFSWWGAWLSDQKDKIVIAPGFVKRKGKMAWGFDRLLPGEWIKL